MTTELGPAPAYGVASAATRDMPFWEWLIAVGLIEGQAEYYSGGEAAQHPGAYGHAITTALQAAPPGSPERQELVDRMYEENIITSADTQAGRDYWTNTAGDAFGADIDNLAKAAGVKFGDASATAGTTTDTQSGIMAGGTLTRITRQGQEDIWAMTYTSNGATHVYTFDSRDQVTAALGEGAFTSGYIDLAEEAIDTRDGTIFSMGPATPLIGQTDDYNAWLDDIQRSTAIRAGVRDPSKLGEYLSNPEVQRIMAQGTAGGWTEQQIMAEIRGTDYYQNELYPGISSILASGEGGLHPEAQWWAYHNSVEDNLASLGYAKDADGSYRSQLGNMLGKGISDTVFNEMAPNYLRASQDKEFASSLDYWLDKTAGRNVTFDDVFDALTGQTSGDLALAVEQGIIQFQANRTSTSLSDEQISRIARMTDLHEREIGMAFSTAEENLLALGDQGLARYGLSEQALVSAAFGLDEGDQTANEVRRLAKKTIVELAGQDDPKAQFYTTFDQRKRPVREGLAAAAPELG
jgi:hypothetical protein